MSNNKDIISNEGSVLRQPSSPSTGEDARRAGRGSLAPSRGKMPEGQKGVGLRIIFMGTPEFAVGTLSALVEGGYNVVAVVTQPDKPVGRHGSVLQPSQVKQYALEHNIPVLQPVKMKDPEFIEQLRSYNADLQVVVAFRMLPEIVWDMPRFMLPSFHSIVVLPLSTGQSSMAKSRQA